MSEQEDFEKWADSPEGSYIDAEGAWQAATKQSEARIKAFELQVQVLREALSTISAIPWTSEEDYDYLAVIIKKALTSTPNPAEWVRRSDMEMVAKVHINSAGQISLISGVMHFDMSKYIGSELYRIKEMA